MNAEILTAREIAEELKTSVPSIRKWTREGMPVLRLGGRLVRFELESALSWFEQRKLTKNGK